MKMIMLRGVGFWRNRSGSWLPHPAYLVDEAWETADRGRIVQYLRDGIEQSVYLGYSYCRFAGGPPREQMGCSDLTDGAWVWPEGLWHYVERYAVRLPNEFVDHMRGNNFRIPAGLNQQQLAAMGTSLEFWRDWARDYIGELPRRKRLVRGLAAILGNASLSKL
jgi:hypothetical protein